MTIYDIIRKKRDGGELTDEEIRFFVQGYTKGDIPDYQASALCMAIYYKGMTPHETATLTLEMAQSGDTVDLSRFGNLSVDKHSTGGVGDKTTLIVAPIVASLGCKVTKMSGRGLGHTGGTVDKLESIAGYRSTLEPDAFLQQVENIGMAVIGQSGNLAPADKKLYALRDVTATVDSLPLITSSIMSKKLAAGSQNIVLDVKVGDGAFMKTPQDAKALATAMVDIGNRCGRNTAALITSMDTPLGDAVGNALEVIEAIEVLKGKQGDLRTLCVALASQMVSLVKDIPYTQAEALVLDALDSGKALLKMREWVSAQGGYLQYIDDTSKFATAPSYTVLAEQDGFITAMGCEEIGHIAVLLGAGRQKKDDGIDHSAGILLHKKTGDKVQKGEPLCTLYTHRADVVATATARYTKAVTIRDSAPETLPLIVDRIGKV